MTRDNFDKAPPILHRFELSVLLSVGIPHIWWRRQHRAARPEKVLASCRLKTRILTTHWLFSRTSTT